MPTSDDVDEPLADIGSRHGGRIDLVGLSKSFDGEVWAVNDIALHIERGELFSLLGSSGCGKTTTLRMIARFEQPTARQILLDGHDIVALRPHRPVNTVFQSYVLFPHLSVEDNVADGLRWRRDRARLDKAEGGLDARLRKDLQTDLASVQAEVGTTFVHVTHDQEQPATAYVADFLGVANLLAADGERGAGGRCIARLGTFALDAQGDSPPTPVELVTRPERVRISPGEARGPNCEPGTVERVVYVGSTTPIHVRLPGREAVQSLAANTGDIPDWPAGTPVGVTLPADTLRALPA